MVYDLCPILHTDERSNDRGWSVIALDPRTFHLVDSEEEACGGKPQRRLRDEQNILDLSSLTNRLPDTSRLYNHFPPAVKTEPEETLLPDFFGADCRVSGSSNIQEKHDMREDQSPKYYRSGEPADELSQQAVDGSFSAGSMNEDSTPDTDQDPTDNQQAPGDHGLLQALVDPNEFGSTGQFRAPGHGPLTTPEFFQFALLEALGGDVHEVEALLGENLAHDSESDEDEDMDYLQNQEMVDADDDDASRSEDGSEEDAYQALDRMLTVFSLARQPWPVYKPKG